MFDPSEKQLAALANMEHYIGVGSNRTQFKDQPEFQEYWNLVSKRSDKVSRHKKTTGPASTPIASAESIEKRNASKTAYYNDEKNLRSYANKYNQRYQPSRSKLCSQLIRKSQNNELSEKICSDLAEYIDENALAMQLTERMREQGKNKNYIKNKLLQRQFPQECIDRCLHVASAETGSVWDNDALTKKVATLQHKGFSLHAIRQKLIEQAADKPLVEAALVEVFGTVNDDDNLKQAVLKLHNKNLDNDSVIKRLVGKGFRYAAIKEHISSIITK